MLTCLIFTNCRVFDEPKAAPTEHAGTSHVLQQDEAAGKTQYRTHQYAHAHIHTSNHICTDVHTAAQVKESSDSEETSSDESSDESGDSHQKPKGTQHAVFVESELFHIYIPRSRCILLFPFLTCTHTYTYTHSLTHTFIYRCGHWKICKSIKEQARQHSRRAANFLITSHHFCRCMFV